MSALNRLWSNLKRFLDALDGMDDPMGGYLLSLEKRIENLENERQERLLSGGARLADRCVAKSA